MRYITAIILILFLNACSTSPLPPDVNKSEPWVPISPFYKKGV